MDQFNQQKLAMKEVGLMLPLWNNGISWRIDHEQKRNTEGPEGYIRKIYSEARELTQFPYISTSTEFVMRHFSSGTSSKHHSSTNYTSSLHGSMARHIPPGRPPVRHVRAHKIVVPPHEISIRAAGSRVALPAPIFWIGWLVNSHGFKRGRGRGRRSAYRCSEKN